MPLMVLMVLYYYELVRGYVIIVDHPPSSYQINGSFYHVHYKVKIIENIYILCEVGQLLNTQCWIYKLYL